MMLATLSRCRSDNGPRMPSRRISACVMMAVRGVRRSCEMFARNCVLRASRDCSSALICDASFSASSSWMTRCSAVVDVDSTGCMCELYRAGSVGSHPSGRRRFVLDRVFQLLPAQQRPVPPAGANEIGVAALFDDTTFVQHDDPGGVANGAHAVRRDDRGAS